MALPVIFRISDDEVTAVFPTQPAHYHGTDVTCYAHVGQHSACSIDWYRTTKPATPEQYKSLLAELKSKGYDNLHVVTRRHSAYGKRFLQNQKRD